MLPCAHFLCDSCRRARRQSGHPACPLDGKPFGIHTTFYAADEKRSLQAHCWNEGNGCKYVGPIEALVLHYDKECTFHAIQCPRCEQRILRTYIAAHYEAGCSMNSSCANGAEPTKQDSLSITSDTINNAVSGFENSLQRGIERIEANICSKMTQQLNTCLQELKALIRDPCSDQLSSLQSQMNALVEQGKTNDASQLRKIVSALKDSENILKEGAKRAEANLSSSLANQQQSLQIVLDYVQQKNRSPKSDWLAASAASREPGKIPWRLEKRLILRKLETFANASVSTLESLRQRTEPWDGQPWISDVQDDMKRSCFISSAFGNAKTHFTVTLMHAEKILYLDKGNFASWNQWIFRDVQVKISCSVSSRREPAAFFVRVECAGTSEVTCLPFTELALAATNRRSGEILKFRKLDPGDCMACLPNETPHFIVTFTIGTTKLAEDGVIDGGKLELFLVFF
ncbi:uncharacterized protein LOC119372610 [Rhipicephalus sanguineus]|uniref:uncharacterized protein LOC119372610 n=1 Tax=Rhipicephalus sanguineus TaxID=34632 RepID=UPI0018959129|nr:uncharacterized protein LOC119372610 [Rhipicephalus sanguineus]